jgi:hypothetical protein
MWSHTPPLRDVQFVIEDMLRSHVVGREMPAFADIEADTARAVLAGRAAGTVGTDQARRNR